MAQYLLPCSCGKTLPVSIGQAGESIDCPCGKSLDIPTMREIRLLEPSLADRNNKGLPNWSKTEGGVFVSGVVVLVLGLIIATIFISKRSKLDTNRPHKYASHIFQNGPNYNGMMKAEEVQQIDLPTSLALWEEINELALSDYIRPGIPMYLRHRQLNRWYLIYIAIGSGLAACGVIGIATSLLMNKWQPHPRKAN